MCDPAATEQIELKTDILVTGATGCFGRHLVPNLVGHGYFMRAATRRPVNLGETVEVHPVGDLTAMSTGFVTSMAWMQSFT